ncbi:MAG: TonB-dependent receptor [Pseudomonadota bacterium]
MKTYRCGQIALSVKLALGIAILSNGFVPTAFAEEDEAIEKIQVTGSSIKRTDIEKAVPVQIIDREEIERSGVASVADLVQSLPVMQGFITAADSVGGGGGGIQTASIHGIGQTPEEYTLVLLNGRRLAPSGSGSAIDLNAIPLAALERIEILTDGASALYGSDAIAGVINFITKKNTEGFDVSARFFTPQDDDGEGWNIDFTAGFGDIDEDGYNILFAYSHDRQDQVSSTGRDFARSGIINFENNGNNYLFFNGSANAIPGNALVNTWLINPDGTPLLNEETGDPIFGNVSFNPYLFANGECAPNTSQIGNACLFDFTSTLEIFPESDRDSFVLETTVAINDNIEVFASGIYTEYEMITRIAPYPTGGFPVSLDSNLYSTYIEPYLTTVLDHPNLTNAQVADRVNSITAAFGQWRALPASNRTTQWDTQSTNLVLGTRGTIDLIDFEAAIQYAKNDSDQNYIAGWLAETPFINALSSGSIDVFAPAGTVTPEDMAGLSYNGNWTNDSTELFGFDASFSMPVFELSGGEALLGAGVDYKSYEYQQTVSDANNEELVLFVTRDSPYNLERETYGAFFELVMPLLDNLEVTASGRFDEIGAVEASVYNADGIETASGVKVNDSANDFTYKLGVKFDLTEDITLRGSYGTAFKAPTMLQIGEHVSEFGVTGGTYICPFSGSDPLFVGCDASGPAQYDVLRAGNPDLENEESTQYTFGVVFSPSPDFNGTIDYWDVEMENLVVRLTEAQIFADPVTYRDLFSVVQDGAIPTLAILQEAVNVGKANYSGIDWNLVFSNTLSFGELRTVFGGTYMLTSESLRPGTTNEYVSSLGRFGEDDEVRFKVQTQISSTLTTGDFENTVTLNYKTGYQDQFQSAETCSVTLNDALGRCVDMQLRVSSYTKVDYLLRYNVMDDLKASLGVNNVFAREPDLSLRTSGAGHQVGFDPRYYDVFGRAYYVQIDYSF